MFEVSFDYNIKGQILSVIAGCKNIINGEYVEGLTLTFLNENEDRVKVEYDKELFEDLENEALYLLADAYYNPELNFKTH